jgi:hypothetical protein
MYCYLVMALLYYFSSVTCASDGIEQPTKTTECLPTDEEMTAFHCLASESLRVPCVDTDDRCDDWAKQGECKNNPQYMLVQCRKSCASCIPLHGGSVSQIAPHYDTRPEVLRRLYETQEYLHENAKRNVNSLKHCINKHELCTHWWSIGECETNPGFMSQECSPVCQTCESIVP